MADICSKCGGHIPKSKQNDKLRWDYCVKCQAEIDKKYYIPKPIDPRPIIKDVICFVCKRRVPKKELTYESQRFGKGLCSRKCSDIMYSTYGYAIPNRLGKKQFPVRDKEYEKRKKLKAKMINGDLKRK